MSDDEIVKDFLVESHENLDRLDHDLVELEKDPTAREILASIFRTIHTIKGTCGFLGFNCLEKVAHVGENLLARLRDGQLRLSPEITTALLKMVDSVREMLASIEVSGNEGKRDDSQLIATLTQLLTNSTSATPAQDPAPSKEQPTRTDPPQVVPSVSDILVSKDLVNAGEVAATVAQQNAGDSRPVNDIPADKGSVKPQEIVEALNIQQQARGQNASDSTIRVGVSLLDQLMNLVGELVLARNQIIQFSNSTEGNNLLATSQRLNLITTELQEGVMKTRMQPIGNIWNKLPRVVRDLALGCGKQARIEMEGQDTELDKTIIEAIKDPLTHLVRNAIDHGIELPADRTKVGKNPEGNVLLRAFHEGGQVNIEITDDGAGLDLARVRNKAVQKGLISREQADRMSEREACNLIFMPGLSTAEKVTNVSGRGVGMDVVKTNIEKIGGVVDLQTRPGTGTTVRMKIPLTLAIIPALMVTSAGDRYAIPQVSLLELVRLEGDQSRKSIEMIHGAPVYRLRGRLLPLVYLSHELQLEDNAQALKKSGKEAKSRALDFTLARDKHREWMHTLQQVLEGKLTLTPDQAGSHEKCALGLWLYSVGVTEYGAIAEVHTLEKTHQHFHSLVRETITLRERGGLEAAARELAQVDRASKEIMELLTTVKNKVLERENLNIVVLQADDQPFGLVVEEINDTQEIVVKPLSKQMKSIKTYAGATILGDGRVALILDVLGLAQRASVVRETRERTLMEEAEAVEKAAEKQTFLLFAGLGDSRMAIPLSALSRLEEFPISQVEMTGKQWVTQYRGQILPLIRLSVVLEERRNKLRALQALPAADSEPLQVLVLNHEGQSFGLVVEKIVDIVEDRADVKSAATRPCVLHSVVIGGRVTEMLDIPAILKTASASTIRPPAAMCAAEGAL